MSVLVPLTVRPKLLFYPFSHTAHPAERESTHHLDHRPWTRTFYSKSSSIRAESKVQGLSLAVGHCYSILRAELMFDRW
jgi:hypothetical protein